MEKRIKQAFVYILTNKRCGTLYIGLTTNLVKRIEEHKSKIVKGFTSEYNLTQLAYYELHGDINSAALRERQMKKWKREWKMNLIEKQNPHWMDLTEDLRRKVM